MSTVIPFPTCRAPVDVNRLVLIDRFRAFVPAHRRHVFNSLSDEDQFNIAQHFMRAPEARPAWCAYEADAAQG